MSKDGMKWGYDSLINPDGIDPWIIAIGKFFINFGALEYQSYAWINRLAKDKEIILSAQKSSFERRVGLILNLLNNIDIPSEKKKEISVAWKKTKSLSETRKHIAHNTVVFDKGSAIGIPDAETIDLSTGRTPLITLDFINLAIDAIVEVSEELKLLLPA